MTLAPIQGSPNVGLLSPVGHTSNLRVGGDRIVVRPAPAIQVMISYSSDDQAIGDAACELLEARGLRCWIAPRDILPGREWGGAIMSAISQARVMVLIYTGRSNGSPHVRREVERAVARGLHVIPVRVENVPMSPTLEYFISAPHWLDAISPPLGQHFERLAKTIHELLDTPADDAAVADESSTSAGDAPPTPAETPSLAAAAQGGGGATPTPSGIAAVFAATWRWVRGVGGPTKPA